MRVAIAAETFLPRMNGVVNSVIQVVRHLRGRGIPVLIIAPDTSAPDEFEGVPVARVRSMEIPGVHDFDVSLATASAVTSILRDFAPTVVHLASPFVLGAQVQGAARSLGIPTVAVFQTDIAGYAQHYGLGPLAFIADGVVRRIHTAADITLVPSTACASYMQRLGVRETRLWRRGVDLQTFSPTRRSQGLRRSWGAEHNTVIGFIGRLAPEKKAHMLAHVAGRADVQVVIVGDGPCRADLERRLPNAAFTGRLTGGDLGAAAASFDVLVAPGEKETFCQVIQEGMASGVAVVAPAVGGPLDLIDHDRTGVLYAAGSSTDFTAAVSRLAADALLRRRLSDAALHQVSGRSWSALGDELVGHYLDAMGADVVAAA